MITTSALPDFITQAGEYGLCLRPNQYDVGMSLSSDSAKTSPPTQLLGGCVQLYECWYPKRHPAVAFGVLPFSAEPYLY